MRSSAVIEITCRMSYLNESPISQFAVPALIVWRGHFPNFEFLFGLVRFLESVLIIPSSWSVTGLGPVAIPGSGPGPSPGPGLLRYLSRSPPASHCPHYNMFYSLFFQWKVGNIAWLHNCCQSRKNGVKYSDISSAARVSRIFYKWLKTTVRFLIKFF